MAIVALTNPKKNGVSIGASVSIPSETIDYYKTKALYIGKDFYTCSNDITVEGFVPLTAAAIQPYGRLSPITFNPEKMIMFIADGDNVVYIGFTWGVVLVEAGEITKAECIALYTEGYVTAEIFGGTYDGSDIFVAPDACTYTSTGIQMISQSPMGNVMYATAGAPSVVTPPEPVLTYKLHHFFYPYLNPTISPADSFKGVVINGTTYATTITITDTAAIKAFIIASLTTEEETYTGVNVNYSATTVANTYSVLAISVTGMTGTIDSASISIDGGADTVIAFTEVDGIEGDCYQFFSGLADFNVGQADTYRGVVVQGSELTLGANINLLPQNYTQIQNDTKTLITNAGYTLTSLLFNYQPSPINTGMATFGFLFIGMSGGMPNGFRIGWGGVTTYLYNASKLNYL